MENGWVVTQRVITEIGRYNCEPDFLPDDMFCEHIKGLENKGYRLETFTLHHSAVSLTYANTETDEGICFVTFTKEVTL